ncbi:peptidase [Cupriavidus sp. HPC(L)]|uniref:head maturation protease, ClpP-related n=1 Tax=Cupriavidus sp. HPC(L) TaxID=1217418 RepID=UPI0002919230|nr:head maturation protease, ClpP-related [Cupriavidus sp. HPC(L)]ESH90784.1 peptidase [Cupriavidus sp. HPC(L)]
MSLLNLPEIRADHRLNSAQFDLRPDAVEKWHPEVRAAKGDDDTTISIYDAIGENWDGTGVTSKRISAALRSIGSRAITVNINSPGGDFFEGVAIYNLLREHKAKVTVQVMGVAASAASVIAMAGDDILMGDGAFLMIHNAWAVAIGNRHDMRATAEVLEPFDGAMAKVYAERSGISPAEAAAMMDRESWIGADEAVQLGFATGLLDSAEVSRSGGTSAERRAMAVIEASMAKAGYTRSARREAFKALFAGKPGAAGEPATPRAGTSDINWVASNLLNF